MAIDTLLDPFLSPIFFAAIGGILPVFVWLAFWLREDEARPEPNSLIALAFIAGMLAVPLVLPLQQFALSYFQNGSLALIATWATVEELTKYLLAGLLILWRKAVNEPIDMVIYMITVALGFAGLENALFLLNPLTNGNLLESILTGDFRFLGATLLHTISSGTIGLALALAFFKDARTKRNYVAIGVILAIFLHTMFNFFIINTKGEQTLVVFLSVWVAVILLILMFEGVKRMGRTPIRK